MECHVMHSHSPVCVIKELFHIEDLLNELNLNENVHNLFLIWDIDKTIANNSGLGGDSYFKLSCIYAGKNDSVQVLNLFLYEVLQFYTKLIAVEKNTADIIKTLQKKYGIPMIGLTARGQLVSNPTISNLKALDIDFSRCWKHLPDIVKLNEGVIFSKGIVFCAGRDKGHCFEDLATYLKNEKLMENLPSEIHMIDDSGPALDAVGEAVLSLGSSFRGSRYGFLDLDIHQFNWSQAVLDLQELSSCLPETVLNAIEVLNIPPGFQAYHNRYLSSLLTFPHNQINSNNQNNVLHCDLNGVTRSTP